MAEPLRRFHRKSNTDNDNCNSNDDDDDDESRQVFDLRCENKSTKNRDDEKEASPPPRKISLPSPPGHRNSNDTRKNLTENIEEQTGSELILLPPIPPGSLTSTVATDQVIARGEPPIKESRESIGRNSRIELGKEDAKKLRSATLGRVGRIFKSRAPTQTGLSKTGDENSKGPREQLPPAAVAVPPEEQQRRKEKTHSLGRMLRLVDKDGAPRKLFSHPRTGSLTRLRKLESTVGNTAGSQDEPRNLFTRMLNQLRGKNSPAGVNAEPNLQSATELSPTSPSSKPSLGTRLMMSLTPRGNSGSAAAEPVVESTA